MLYRNQLRTVLSGVETTEKTRSVGAPFLAFALAGTDYFYFGYHEKFVNRYFYLKTPSVVASVALTVETWDGGAWQPVDDLIDETGGFTKSGFLSWKNLNSWSKSAQAPITKEQLYWARVKCSLALTAGTQLQAVLNLFCDDALLKVYYPELVSDSRFLPPSQTDLVPQYEAAKNLIVLRLIQQKAIKNESQILDVNELAVAAVHASAFIILTPIANDEDTRLLRDKAEKNMNNELEQAKQSLDSDNSGEISEVEEDVGTVFRARR